MELDKWEPVLLKFVPSIGKVILCDIKQEFVDNGIGTITKNLKRSVSKERINQDEMDNTLANINTTLELNDLKDCNIIIEAIVENIDIKKKLFLDLGNICNKDTYPSLKYIQHTYRHFGRGQWKTFKSSWNALHESSTCYEISRGDKS